MVKVIEVGAKNTIINNYIAELRNVEVQATECVFAETSSASVS